MQLAPLEVTWCEMYSEYALYTFNMSRYMRPICLMKQGPALLQMRTLVRKMRCTCDPPQRA